MPRSGRIRRGGATIPRPGSRRPPSTAPVSPVRQAPLERAPLFLPCLTGERTPHDDPHAKGVFFGLGPGTSRGDLGWAVLAGVAFAFADGCDALLEAGAGLDRISVIGGGARSPLWGRILAAVLRRPLTYHAGGEVGPALGAARPARLAGSGGRPEEVCAAPPVDRVVEPEEELAGRLAGRLERWRALYRILAPEMRRFDGARPVLPDAAVPPPVRETRTGPGESRQPRAARSALNRAPGASPGAGRGNASRRSGTAAPPVRRRTGRPARRRRRQAPPARRDP